MSAAAPLGAPGEPTVLVESSRALPVVSMTIAERNGALEDPPGKEGLARLTKRLARRTGGGRTAEAIDLRIDSLGGALAVDVGHSTVAFHGTVIARSLDAFAELLLDVVARPGLDAEELGKLRRETVAELVEARDHDRELGQKWFRRALFSDHPYGRTVAGTEATLAAIGPADVAAHHLRTAVRGNLVVAFAGDVDEPRAREIAARLSAAVPAGTARKDGLPEPTMPPGRRLLFVDKPERTQTQILIGGLGTHPHDPDHTALHVGSTVLGGTFTARLMQEIRAKRGWSYGAYANLPYDRHRRGFSLWTFPKASDAAPCVALELEMLERWVAEGITPRELAWAKRYLVRSHAFAVDTAGKRVAQRLDEVLYGLPEGYHSRYIEDVRALTLDQVNAAIRARISPEDLLVTVVGTASEVEAGIRAAIPRLSSSETVRYDAE